MPTSIKTSHKLPKPVNKEEELLLFHYKKLTSSSSQYKYFRITLSRVLVLVAGLEVLVLEALIDVLVSGLDLAGVSHINVLIIVNITIIDLSVCCLSHYTTV